MDEVDAMVERLEAYDKVATACGNRTESPRNLARMAGEAATLLRQQQARIAELEGSVETIAESVRLYARYCGIAEQQAEAVEAKLQVAEKALEMYGETPGGARAREALAHIRGDGIGDRG